MVDILVIALVGLLVGLAAGYIARQKKKGVKCIGCSAGNACSGGCRDCPGCSNPR